MATKVGPVVRRNRPGTKAKASRLSLASYGRRRVFIILSVCMSFKSQIELITYASIDSRIHCFVFVLERL